MLRRCNGDRSAHLAAHEHVSRWVERFDDGSEVGCLLAERADALHWEHDAARTLGVARSIDLRLPEGSKLWRLGKDFVDLDRAELVLALTSSA